MSTWGKSGQGLIESVLVLPLAISFVVLLMGLSYRALVFYFADHSLHEALICTDDAPMARCQEALGRQLRKVLIAGEDLSVHLQAHGKTVKGTIKITRPLALSIEKEVRFPVKVTRSWL